MPHEETAPIKEGSEFTKLPDEVHVFLFRMLYAYQVHSDGEKQRRCGESEV